MQILKAIDASQNTYFAFKIQKDSHEMNQIKSCPTRYWDKDQKVWLVPYSMANWKKIMTKMGNIKYAVSYTPLPAHKTVLDIVFRLLFVKKKT